MRAPASALSVLLALSLAPTPRSQGPAPTPSDGQEPLAAANPYRLEPFHDDYPVALEYPNRHGLEYDRTRRQVCEQIVANLQGAGRRETWQTATEFFWNGPEELIEPLIAAMDRYFGDPSMQDMVRNCVEAMGRMGNPAFDEALRRALEHKNASVRQAALAALTRSGTEATLRGMMALWPQMDGRSRQAWLRAARTRLGAEAVPMFRELMMADFPVAVRDQVLFETLELSPRDAAEVLRGRWHEAVGEFKAIIAGVLHAAGDAAGTTWLQETLQGEDLAMLPLAIRHCAFGDPGLLRDSLLSLSSHPRAEIRFELANVLKKVDGEEVADVYEVLSRPDEAWETKSLALRELTRRGRTAAASALLDEVETASGTRLQLVLNMLGATADPRAVPVFVARFRDAPPGEGRPFLQSLAVLGCDEAAAALLELFRGPEKVVDRGGAGGGLTTTNYIPLLLMNLRGSEDLVAAAFEALPASDWGRRALLMPTVIGMAADSNDPELTRRAVPILERILFDREELPQLRVQALNLLTRRYLTLENVLRLRRARFEESPGMRALWTDFLLDYF